MSTEENGREDITPEPGYNGFSKASREEREDTLTRIMRNSAAFPALIKTGHVLTSIDLLNKMDGLYSVPFGFNDNRVINILCDKETSELIANIGERTKTLSIEQRMAEARLPLNSGATPDSDPEKSVIPEREKSD